jgi:hypothetical protein
VSLTLDEREQDMENVGLQGKQVFRIRLVGHVKVPWKIAYWSSMPLNTIAYDGIVAQVSKFMTGVQTVRLVDSYEAEVWDMGLAKIRICTTGAEVVCT